MFLIGDQAGELQVSVTVQCSGDSVLVGHHLDSVGWALPSIFTSMWTASLPFSAAGFGLPARIVELRRSRKLFRSTTEMLCPCSASSS